MERFIRTHLALFSFDHDNNKYTQNAEYLRRSLEKIEEKISHLSYNIDLYCNMTRLDRRKSKDYLTICIKNNQLYLGFYNKDDNILTFYDDKNYMERDAFSVAVGLLENNIVRDIENGLEINQNFTNEIKNI